jgi:hypothetical protein
MNPTLASFARAVFNDMRQFLLPEHLARLAKASKEMQIIVIPVLKPLKQNKQAMYDLMLRLFPNLRHGHLRGPGSVTDASYYTGLLDAYFTLDHSNVPPQNIVSRVVGMLLYQKELNTTTTVNKYVMPAMQTAEGCRRVLRAIEEKRGQLRRSIEDRSAMHEEERNRLQQTFMDEWIHAIGLYHVMLQLHETFEATLPQLRLPLPAHAEATVAAQRVWNHRALEDQTQAIKFFGDGVEQLELPEQVDLRILDQLEMLMRTSDEYIWV